MARPWHDLPGREFAALRLLPDDVAGQLWRRASRHATGLVLTTRWCVASLLLCVFALACSIVGVFALTQVLGWGVGVRLVADVVVHLILFHQLRHRYVWIRANLWLPVLRP